MAYLANGNGLVHIPHNRRQEVAHTNQLQSVLNKARRKGLSIQRNQFRAGWSITLPYGSTHHAKTNEEMVRFVEGY